MSNKNKTILSLCDYSGNWSEPYREAGYNVIQVDLKRGDDIRMLKYPGKVHGILAAPPCTHFAGSGARWWKQKGNEAIIEGMALIDACLRLVAVCEPTWWVLENPVGRLKDYIGPYKHIFNPNEYAGWADNPDLEAYTKKTCLWGNFNIPVENSLPPVLGSMLWKNYGGKSERTKAARSVTPTGFARAFFKANP